MNPWSNFQKVSHQIKVHFLGGISRPTNSGVCEGLVPAALHENDRRLFISLLVGGGYPQVLFFFCAPYSCGCLIFWRCNVCLPKHKPDDFVLSEAKGFDSSDLQVSRIRIQAIFKRNWNAKTWPVGDANRMIPIYSVSIIPIVKVKQGCAKPQPIVFDNDSNPKINEAFIAGGGKTLGMCETADKDTSHVVSLRIMVYW